MSLETGTYISDLNSANPVGTDVKSQGDDHIRLVKSTILATFPNVTGAITPTHTDLNQLLNAGSHAGMLNDIGLLDDPGADRLLFWDESAGAAGLLSLTTGLSLSGTSLGIDTSVVPQLAATNLFTASGAGTTNAAIVVESSVPAIVLKETDATTDEGIWRFYANANVLALTTNNDAETSVKNILTVSRTAEVVGAVAIYGTSLSAAGTLAWGGGSAIDSSSHVALNSGSNTFLASQTISVASDPYLRITDGTLNNYIELLPTSNYFQLTGAATGGGIRFAISTNAAMLIDPSRNFNFYSGTVTTDNASASEVGYKGVPGNNKSANYTLAAGDQSQRFRFTSGAPTVPNSVFHDGDTIVIINDTGSAMTITQGTGLTMILAGTSTTGNRTLAQYGIATIHFFYDTSHCLISGAGLS